MNMSKSFYITLVVVIVGFVGCSESPGSDKVIKFQPTYLTSLELYTHHGLVYIIHTNMGENVSLEATSVSVSYNPYVDMATPPIVHFDQYRLNATIVFRDLYQKKQYTTVLTNTNHED